MTKSEQLPLLADFLNRYVAFEDKIAAKRTVAEIADFTKLFKKYAVANALFNVTKATTAPFYNIFNILNISHYETKLHTPFLRHLLTPSASHEQGRLFFDEFLKRFLPNKQDITLVSNIYVHEEMSTVYGRLDLFLEYTHEKERRAIVIENKIRASDQEMQLERYYDYLQNKEYQNGCYHIIYLKPHQSRPPEYSITPTLLKKLENNAAFTALGYHEDIAPWLLSLLPLIAPANVRHTLSQYVTTIKTL